MPKIQVLFCAALLFFSFAVLRAAPPELKAQGNQIVVKSTGTPVRLTGVNVPSLSWGAGEKLNESLIASIDLWQSNIIRLPVSQSLFLAGGTYLTTVDTFIAQASAANVYVILDLHGFGQPDANSTAFWTSAANRYKNNPAVLFGLFNEPHGLGWEGWKNGDENGPGMQALLDTVRATGALNIVLVGGGDWAYDLSGILNGYALSDTTGNGIVYDSHLYPQKSSWQAKVGNVAQSYPVLLGEIGHFGGTSAIGLTFDPPEIWIPKVMDWVNTHNLHLTGWSLHPGAAPAMISDFNFSPTPYWGGPALVHLQSYRNPSAQRVVGGTVIGTPGTRLNPASGVLTDATNGAVSPFNGGYSSWFDAPTASGSWTGLDLIQPQRITKIRYMPRKNYGNLMIGGKFEASNSATFSSGVVTLYTIPSAPDHSGDVYTSATISNTNSYRYVRYVGPTNSYCNVASILFYTGDAGTAAAGGSEVIVDNKGPYGVSFTGTWVTGSGVNGYYGTNYHSDGNAGKGTKSARFTPNLGSYGYYEVFARWTSHANRASNVPIDIAHAGGSSMVEVDQRTSGGTWVSLGSYPFNAGTAHNVLIGTAGTDGYVIADAIRFVRQADIILDNADPFGVIFTGTWSSSTSAALFYKHNFKHDGNDSKGGKTARFTPDLPEAGNYEVFAQWGAHSNRATNVPIDVIHSGGTSTATVNQQLNGGTWNSLGVFTFNQGTAGSVLIRTTGTNGYVCADAVKFVKVP